MRSRYRACGAAEADARACGAAGAAQSQYENIGALTSLRYKQQICDSKRGGAGGAAVGVRRNIYYSYYHSTSEILEHERA